MAALLNQAFAQLFGDKRSAQERTRFLMVAAPLMRAIAIEYANAANTTSARMNTAGVQQWLQRLESFDPQCVQMIDLHYFAGLHARDIAVALNVSPQTVLQDLRFAKAWLRARMQWISAGSTRD